MKPVAQTKFRDDHGEGNSLQACLASIFERPLDTVPHFRIVDNWWDALQEWLQGEYGVWLLPVETDRPPLSFKHGPLGWHMIVGMTAHGRHVVVGHNGYEVHDPHPDGEGLLTVEKYYVFVRTFEGGPTPFDTQHDYPIALQGLSHENR